MILEEKYQQKRQVLINRTAQALAVNEQTATTLLSIPRQQSLRTNTLKSNVDATVSALTSQGIEYSKLPWISEGILINKGTVQLRGNTLIEEGSVYIQNAASWLPIVALDPHANETVLDMCAAPGGKTSHIAQRAHNEASITANDNSRPRLHKLQQNLLRLGVVGVTYTLHDATRLARHLEPESFDKILLDAPCSGEGMMTLDNKKDFESWSVAHIKRLQQLQKKLLVQAWQLLKPGGRLVYSTCTMAPEENEAVIDYLLRHNDDVEVEPLTQLKESLDNAVEPVKEWNTKHYDSRIAHALRLKPSSQVEAFFVISLRKIQ